MDGAKMEAGIRLFLEGLEVGSAGGEIARTPSRVARAWMEDLAAGYGRDPDAELTWTAAPPDCGPVVLRDVGFTSICIHHLLPFSGHAQIAYLPAERLAGLSKLGRVVDIHARRLQIQEHLTAAIADTLDRALRPRAALVALEAEHTCMTLRGVRKTGSRLLTWAARGVWSADPMARREILDRLLPGGAGTVSA